MKKLILLGLTVLLFTACKKQSKSNSSTSTEITETDVVTETYAPAEADEPETKKAAEPAAVTEQEIIIIETLADTPVIYPGCSGTFPEIRACSIKNFVNFITDNFNSDIASDRDLSEGTYKIRAEVKIDKSGKSSVLEVDAPNTTLEKEVVRIINKLPNMTAATKDGKPVDVSFILPVDFVVE